MLCGVTFRDVERHVALKNMELLTSRSATLNVTLSVTFQTILVFAERHVNVTFCHVERDAERRVSTILISAERHVNVTFCHAERDAERHVSNYPEFP